MNHANQFRLSTRVGLSNCRPKTESPPTTTPTSPTELLRPIYRHHQPTQHHPISTDKDIICLRPTCKFFVKRWQFQEPFGRRQKYISNNIMTDLPSGRLLLLLSSPRVSLEIGIYGREGELVSMSHPCSLLVWSDDDDVKRQRDRHQFASSRCQWIHGG